MVRVVVVVAVMLVLELVGDRVLIVVVVSLAGLLLLPGAGRVRRRSTWRGVGAAGAGQRLQRQREGKVRRAVRVEARGGERRRLRLEHGYPSSFLPFFPYPILLFSLVFFFLFLFLPKSMFFPRKKCLVFVPGRILSFAFRFPRCAEFGGLLELSAGAGWYRYAKARGGFAGKRPTKVPRDLPWR